MQAEDDKLNAANIIEQPQADVVTGRPHIVIVGAGFGGLNVALALRNAPVRVTVIDRNNHHLFQPLLYQAATAELSPAEICAPIRHVLKHSRNTNILMAEVAGIDVQKQRVLMHEQAIDYDYLVIATGAGSNYFGHDDWQQLAPGMKSIVEARAIRARVQSAFEAAERESDAERIKTLLTFVLVGAGPTGVELAGALAEMAHKSLASEFRHIDPASARILLIEGEPDILASFPASLSRRAHRKLTRMGVEIKTGIHVTMVHENSVTVGDESIAAGTIIWTAGVKASAAGEWLGAKVDSKGRVKVLDDLTLPNQPRIYVIGDTATLDQGGKPLPGVAQVAIQQGQYVAARITAQVAGKLYTRPFHYRDEGMLATIGRSYAVADLHLVRLSGFVGWLVWVFVHILFLIGFRNRYITLFQWGIYYFTFERGARLLSFEEQQLLR